MIRLTISKYGGNELRSWFIAPGERSAGMRCANTHGGIDFVRRGDLCNTTHGAGAANGDARR